MTVQAGERLFAAGEPSDALFVLISGALGSSLADAQGRPQLQGRIKAGEPVGEMGLLSGKPRSTDVIALRDSDLLRLGREEFERVLLQYPAAALLIARVIVERLSARNQARPGRVVPRTVALLPAGPGVDAHGFVQRLVAELGKLCRVALAAPQPIGLDTIAHLNALEGEHDLVLYLGSVEPDDWRRLCVRQADLQLELVNAAEPPRFAVEDRRAGSGFQQRHELVLLHPAELLPGAAGAWLDALEAQGRPAAMHHHVRAPGPGDKDLRRLVRLVLGRGNGLVLSGGGARGFAHLGVMRALEAVGIEIDVVAGTSIGAIMGAAIAAEWGDERRCQTFRRTFVDSNPLGDYTFPFASIARGRRVSERLRASFGDGALEDLALPFVCMSADLTAGRAHSHRRGELWRALRASVAIPGVLPPVMQGGTVLVDGGALDNFPVEVLRRLGAAWVLGVDIGSNVPVSSEVDAIDMPSLWRLSEWRERWKKSPSALQILMRTALMHSASATQANRAIADFVLEPELPGISMLDWKAFDRAIVLGYEDALPRLTQMAAVTRAER